MVINFMRSLVRSGYFGASDITHRCRGAFIFYFKHFHVDLCLCYGKFLHRIRRAIRSLFQNNCLALQAFFVFFGSSFRASNSKTVATTFRFTSILVFIFGTNSQQQNQQQLLSDFVRIVWPPIFRVTVTNDSIFFVCATMSCDTYFSLSF